MSVPKYIDLHQPPPRWLNCPRIASVLIVNTFLAFKVPLNEEYDLNVPLECRFNISMLLDSVKNNFGSKVGLIIDLTNTNRFYNADLEVKQKGIEYVKIRCKGHGETPSEENKKYFISVVEKFVRTNPNEIIGVHCTHGFNRTGFLICSYLVEELDYSVDMAISMFARARPPGIYKQEYLDKLYNTYIKDKESRSMLQVPLAPPLPTWEEESIISTNVAASTSSNFNNRNNQNIDVNNDEEEDEIDSAKSENIRRKFSEDNSKAKEKSENLYKRKRTAQESNNLNSKFADPDLEGVEACTDPNEINMVRKEIQALCGWNGVGFPGAQPVSMNQENIDFLLKKKYQVSWKADGTRYLMLINGQGKTYLVDRDNSVFITKNLAFMSRKTFQHLSKTLLDGEFVIDVDPTTNNKIPRFLIYDIIHYEKEDIGKENFSIRMEHIEEIIQARYEAMRLGKINRQNEPFSVRKKQFYPINESKKLLSEEFTKQITHGIDGLIYQPIDESYKAGRCETMLKWKPPSMNSVDFLLKIVNVNGEGMLPEKIGYLYVLGYQCPYSNIKVTKQIAKLDNKIIECRWFENRWDFMRVRFDKSYPNHLTTALAVCESIKNPVTQEMLLNMIQKIENEKQTSLTTIEPSQKASITLT